MHKLGVLTRRWMRQVGIEVNEAWLENQLKKSKTSVDELLLCVEEVRDRIATEASNKTPDFQKGNLLEFSRMLTSLVDEYRRMSA